MNFFTTTKNIGANKCFQSILVIILLVSFALMLVFTAKEDSLTNDEPVHIPAGYLYTKGKYVFNFEHPPLINYLSGISVRLFANPKEPKNPETEQYHYGDQFLFKTNFDKAQNIIFSARIPIIILTILLGIIIFLWARSLWGYL